MRKVWITRAVLMVPFVLAGVEILLGRMSVDWVAAGITVVFAAILWEWAGENP